LKRLADIAQRIWIDPVGSKILGSIGYAVLSGVGGVLVRPLLRWNSTVSLMTCSAAAIEILLVWITFRGPSLIITAAPGARYFPSRTRKITGIAAAVLPILGPALGWGVALEICTLNRRTFVFVANFEASPQSANYRVTRTIFEHLRGALRDFPDTVPELIGHSVSWDQDPTSILTWCQRQQKAILVWGDFDTTQQKVVFTAHFRLLRGSKVPLQGWHEQRSPLGDLESFTTKMSWHMGSLTAPY